jgi:hypothetical protein
MPAFSGIKYKGAEIDEKCAVGILIANAQRFPGASYQGQKADQKVGTRYVVLAVRTLVDPNDPKDLNAVHALQDAIKVDQTGGPGKFEVPNWDQAS